MPRAPCEAFPAKKTPGSETLSQNGVSAGMRPSATVTSPSSGRSCSGVWNPVAAITSSTSNSSVPSQVVPRVNTRSRSPTRSIRSMVTSIT